MVSRTFVSWNQIAAFLRRIDELLVFEASAAAIEMFRKEERGAEALPRMRSSASRRSFGPWFTSCR